MNLFIQDGFLCYTEEIYEMITENGIIRHGNAIGFNVIKYKINLETGLLEKVK